MLSSIACIAVTVGLCSVGDTYVLVSLCVFFFFQAEDGIRDLVRSRGLGDVYKRQDRSRTRPPWVWSIQDIQSRLVLEL